jgi:hypothetical protein
MRLIGGRLLEVQHEAGALTRAGHTDRPHIALVDFHAAHPQAVADLRQVHRHARRRLDDEARGLRRQGWLSSTRTTSPLACWLAVTERIMF